MATSVNRLGFEFKLSNNIDRLDFYQYLISRNEGNFEYAGTTYILYVSFLNDYLVGQILKYKDDEHFLESKKDTTGNLIVTKRKTTEGYNGTEAASFIINPKTGRGLLDTYINSVTPMVFGVILKRIHYEARNQLLKIKKEQLIEIDSVLSKKEALSKARTYFSGEFDFKLLTTDNDLDEISNTIKYLKKVVVEFEPAKVEGSIFEPLLGISKKGKIEVSVAENTTLESIKSSVNSMFQCISGEDSKLKFFGQMHSGEDIQRELGDNLEYFGKQTYDQYVKSLPERLWKNYIYSESTSSLIGAMDKYVYLMGEVESVSIWSNSKLSNVELLDFEKAANDV